MGEDQFSTDFSPQSRGQSQGRNSLFRGGRQKALRLSISSVTGPSLTSSTSMCC